MAYQSKTWSLSDEVVAAVEDARSRGDSPNQFLRKVLGINYGCSKCGTASVGVIKGTPVFECCQAGKTVIGPYHLDAPAPELSSGKGKATVETRGIRPKGDSKR